MMERMGAPPIIIRGEREDADRAANPVIGASTAEQRSMAAIMLDHEETHEESGRRNCHEECQPVADIQKEEHEDPARHERQRGDGDLEYGFPIVGNAINGEP